MADLAQVWQANGIAPSSYYSQTTANPLTMINNGHKPRLPHPDDQLGEHYYKEHFNLLFNHGDESDSDSNGWSCSDTDSDSDSDAAPKPKAPPAKVDKPPLS